MSDVIKNAVSAFTDKDGHLKNALQKEKHDTGTLQVNC